MDLRDDARGDNIESGPRVITNMKVPISFEGVCILPVRNCQLLRSFSEVLLKNPDKHHKMYTHMKGGMRRTLTTSCFYSAAVVSFMVVAAPQILPCPARARPIGADTNDVTEGSQ